MSEIQYYSAEGLAQLKEELLQLETVERPRISAMIAEARDKGDLSENAEYKAAKDEQSMLESEIAEIEDKLKFAVIIKETAKKGTVSIGSKVDFLDESLGEVFTYEIVGTTEADVEKKRISNESPIGGALLGKKVGDKVEIIIPAGKTTVVIKKVY